MISFSRVVPSVGLSPRPAQPGCKMAVATSGGVDSAVAPKEGVFVKVIQAGLMKINDTIKVLESER